MTDDKAASTASAARASSGSPSSASTVSVFSWLWRSYLRVALIPLIFIELVFLGIYVVSHEVGTSRTLAHYKQAVTSEVSTLAHHEAGRLSQRLATITTLTRLFAAQAGPVLVRGCPPNPAERARLAFSPQGALYTTTPGPHDNALFYSGAVPIHEEQIDKAVCASALTPLMQDIRASDPMVDQIYINTWDSMNLIHPSIDVLKHFSPGMAIPEYNFYYEADRAHNPSRAVVWTDVYLDPAGRGWMASAVAPVYDGERLEAVAGVDITVGTFIERVLDTPLPFGAYGLLLDRNGALLAMPERGVSDWQVRPLREASYEGAVEADTFRDPAYNLFTRNDPPALVEALRRETQGTMTLDLNGHPRLLAWSRVEGNGWTYVLVADQDAVFQEMVGLDRTFTRVGYLMAAGLVLFYLLFLGFLYTRTRSMAHDLSGPLAALNGTIRRIAQGLYYQDIPPLPLRELRETGAEVVAMGQRLGRANEELITNREELVVARDAARAAARAKAEFLATVSHEIRTPLNAVIGMTGLLLDGALKPEEAEYARAIQRSGEHLLALVNDILDVSRLESGRLVLQDQPFELDSEARSVISLCGVAASAKGLPLSLSVDPALPSRYSGDAARLRQILSNLVGNAIKFTDRGEVRVRLEPGPDTGGCPWLRCSVIDTGIGIPAERLGDLFVPFQQLDGSTTRRHGGTGLGLAISRRLARLMGGDITVESAPGVGSTFTLMVPLRPLGDTSAPRSPLPAPSVPSGGDPPQNRTLRVLIAEDIPENQILAQAVVERQGHSAVLVPNGREAVDRLIADGPFDLVLMDIQMPVMDGLEATRTIRALPASVRFPDDRPVAQVPIVALTADALPGDRERFLNAGLDDHLAKPLNARRLRALLADVAAGRPLRAAPPPVETTPPTLESPGRLEPVDPGALAQLRAALGVEFVPYLRAAEETLRQRATALTPTLDRGAFTEVSELVHGLRGTLAALGMVESDQLCGRLRIDLEGGAGMAIRGEIARLVRIIQAAADDLATLIAREPRL
ncbi:hybrid sensor histidine kinase/response regulator [Pararhodospirillum oryzae]|uniref:histidine kinase n=1 Tax=Pararhodospirillum oryzae TaxID=478448 RepID=A0A512HAQ1_9PROT|nr:hybrid sensor histidine kinase/response regulator [Pararhodospirillum oryzae]GEO82524.1 histidine kinase [Pararhodospirillum oryzae]